MRKFFIVGTMLLSLLSIPAFAEVSTTGLSEEQILQLKADTARIVAENAKAKSSADSASVIDTAIGIATSPGASTWGTQAATAAEGIANALGIAAKTVGISVNEFAVSPAGKLVVIGIGVKLFGPLFLNLAISIFGIIGILIMTRFAVRSMCGVASTTQTPKKLFWGLIEYTKTTHTYKGINDLHDTVCFGTWLILVIGFAGITAITLSIG